VKFHVRKFSIPSCIYAEPMPAKAFKLLVFLFNESDYTGACAPGYAAMRLAMRGKIGDAGSNHTVNSSLRCLQKAGWIFTMKRTNSRMAVWLQIPNRFRKEKAPATCISVVAE